jgi:hypothetical protein
MKMDGEYETKLLPPKEQTPPRKLSPSRVKHLARTVENA